MNAPDPHAATWQHWSDGLGGMPPGATELRDIPGVGARHFHAHAAGAVLVYGEPGLGALPAAGAAKPHKPQNDVLSQWGLGDAAALAAAVQTLLAGLNAGTVNPTYSSDPVVASFEAQWNAAGGTPQLAGDGLYGGCAQLALASQNGGSAPPALVPNQSDGTFNCANPGPYSVPGGGGGGCGPGSTYDPGSGNCLYPDPGTCAAGTKWDPVQATCVPGVPPPPPPPPPGTTPGSSSSSTGTIVAVGGGLLVLGIVAVVALGAVGSPSAAASPSTGAKKPTTARKAPAHRTTARKPAHHTTTRHAHA